MSDPRALEGQGVAAMLASLAVGALGGGLATWFLASEALVQPQVIEVAVRPSQAELQIECLQFMQQTATTLEEAQTRVSALEIRIRAKEVEIDQLEGALHQETTSTHEIGERLEKARVQLSTLEHQLAEAREESSSLQADLEKAKKALAGTKLQLAAAEAQYVEERESSLELKWENFVQSAQAAICEGGAAAVVATCREQVRARLSPHEQRYKGCVRSEQAIPEVKQADNGEQIPEFATWIDERDRSTRGWYLLFCDPELPEARGPQAQRTDAAGLPSFD